MTQLEDEDKRDFYERRCDEPRDHPLCESLRRCGGRKWRMTSDPVRAARDREVRRAHA